MTTLTADIAVIGASLGGVIAAWRACEQGKRVILTAEFDWIGGQMTAQAVPPDEHRLIENGGASASYLAFRRAIRSRYSANANFVDRTEMTEGLNPGDGWVSRLCFEPTLAVDYFEDLLRPYLQSGQLQLLRRTQLSTVDVVSKRINAVTILRAAGKSRRIEAAYFLDATDTGELIALAKLPYRLGKEAQAEFGEPDAPTVANALDQQPVTMVMALRNDSNNNTENANSTIVPMPENYQYWQQHVLPHYQHQLFSTSMPGAHIGTSVSLPLFATGDTLDWWRYRRIVSARNWLLARAEISLINWAQNDYGIAPLLDGKASMKDVIAAAKNLSTCFHYWLQTKAPHANGGGYGYPHLQLDGEATGTPDGFAQQIYVRESRRIVGLTTLVQQDILAQGGDILPSNRDDSVGVAWYNMDIHPTCVSGHAVNARVRPFTLPIGCFIASDCENLIPACKNISVTHLVNAATRVHPAEWLIGEVAGMLASHALSSHLALSRIAEDIRQRNLFQHSLRQAGIPIGWDDALIARLHSHINSH